MNVKEAIERLRRDVQTMELIKDVGSVSFHGDDMTSHRDDIRTILDLIDKLPKTADGVPVAMFDIVHHPVHGDLQVYWDTLPRCGGARGWVAIERTDFDDERPECTVRLQDCLSTEEAALAAKEANE